MKPIINLISAPCVHCGKEIEHIVHHRIDGENHPDLKLKVLDSSAFVTACCHCIGFSNVPQDFRYFDAAGSTSYMIYYFPEDAINRLEDIIAATIGLRRNGTRVHMIHRLTEIVPIIRAYERGEMPPERLVEVSDQATIRADALSNASDQAMSNLTAAMQMLKETGKFPDGFIEKITNESKSMQSKRVEKYFSKRFFGGQTTSRMITSSSLFKKHYLITNASLSSSYSILRSGWGVFMLIAGILSVILDIFSPLFSVSDAQRIPLFGSGSFTLGWLIIVFLMIVPAAFLRQSGVAPIHKFFAFLWCFVVFIGWMAFRVLSTDSSSPNLSTPNLAMIGGLILCWKLLTEPFNTESSSKTSEYEK